MIAIVRGMKLRVAKQRIETNSVEIIFENKNQTTRTSPSTSDVHF